MDLPQRLIRHKKTDRPMQAGLFVSFADDQKDYFFFLPSSFISLRTLRKAHTMTAAMAAMPSTLGTQHFKAVWIDP